MVQSQTVWLQGHALNYPSQSLLIGTIELEGSCSFRVFTAAQSRDVGQEWESHVHRTFNLLGKAEKKGLLHDSHLARGSLLCTSWLHMLSLFLLVVSLFVVFVWDSPSRCNLRLPWTLNPPDLAPKFWDYWWVNSILIFSLQTLCGGWGESESMFGYLDVPIFP